MIVSSLMFHGAAFLLALGENLWKRFIPKYLEALGAPVTPIGLFGTCPDFLDGSPRTASTTEFAWAW